MKKLLSILTAALLYAPALLPASDHLDAPLLTGRGDVDVNDLYAFQSPTNADNTVLIMTVNPFAASDASFGTDVGYEFQIDNNGDAVADLTYATTFANIGPGQDLQLTRNGESIAAGTSATSLAVAGGGLVQAGLFDDPFFFDAAGFQNGFMFTGTDAFAGANVSAIVLEVPSSELGGPIIGVWARTMQAGGQVDRAGRPAINTALIPSGQKDRFNLGTPINDPVDFGDEVRASITSLSNAMNADDLTPILLPDILTMDTSNRDGFLNGRNLTDDVIDASLNLLSAGAVTGDGVDGNDVPFPSAFPYLAAANIPEPSTTLLGVLGLMAMFGIRRRRPGATA